MNCESFDARLDALLDGRCTPDAWGEAEVHLAACARCRQLFEAMSGRADDLDAVGHEALTAAVVAKTSGGGRACASARERLCDFADGDLEGFDRALVEGHLAHCAECSALADALAEHSRVLHTFASLAPRDGILREVLAATTRKQADPTAAEKIAAWIARAAERPRFSLEVAYVMTVLLLVVLGNPVDAFRDASVRVQPKVSAVAGAVSRPLGEIRSAGAERLSRVERALAPKLAGPETGWTDSLAARAEALLREWIAAPLQLIAAQVSEWAWRVFENVRRAFAATPTEPGEPRAR
jgi:predicted anti-sigma-YlaC factor YlaD